MLFIFFLSGSEQSQIDPQHDNLRATTLRRNAEVKTRMALFRRMGLREKRISPVWTGGWEDVDQSVIEQRPNLVLGASHGRRGRDDLGANLPAIDLAAAQRVKCGFIQADQRAERPGDQVQFILDNYVWRK